MGKPIKVLMIGSDRNLLEKGSAVSERIKEYGGLVEELHIVLLSGIWHGLKDIQLSVNVWVYPTNSYSRWLYIYDAIRLGKKIIYKNKFIRGRSMITAQDPFECGLAAFRIKKKCHLPLEVQLHTDPFSPFFSGFLNQVRKVIARKVLRNANSIRVVTASLKSEIANFTSAGITILPIYVDKKKIGDGQVTFNLHDRYPWRLILLTVSRLAPEKNLSLALSALRRVCDNFRDIGLVIVGSGTEEVYLKSLVKKLKLENNVKFVGWQNDLASYYKTADVFIQTSLFEGYGLSLIEAGLYGLPIITSSVGVATELENGRDAYIYPVGNIEILTSSIIEIIQDKQKLQNLQNNIKDTLETKLISKEEYLKKLKLNWENTALY